MNEDMAMKPDEYQTKDIYLSALLYACRLKLSRVDRSRSICWFVFFNRDKAESISDKYWARDIKVDAKTYAEAVRTLKDMIFSGRD